MLHVLLFANACKPIVKLIQHDIDKPACFSTPSLSQNPSLGFVLVVAWPPCYRCSATLVLECESGSPMLNLSKLLDACLELWVPGTGYILQNGSDHGGEGCPGSASDVAVTEVPSLKPRTVSLPSCYHCAAIV